jgi:hypothetical protein
MAVFWDVALCSLVEVSRRSASIIIAMKEEAASTSETSVNVYQTTRRKFPEDRHLHTRRRDNLKCHLFIHNLFYDAVSISDYRYTALNECWLLKNEFGKDVEGCEVAKC